MWKKFRVSLFGLFSLTKKVAYQEQEIEIDNHIYIVREVASADIKDLLSIEREVYAGELPWTKSAFLTELRSNSKHLYLLIQKKEQVVGFIGCRIYGKDAHITNVAVRTNDQGKGIGLFLLKETQKFAEQHGCKTMSLEVRISNNNAQRVYRKMGFVSNAIKRGYYDENHEDALEMILDLEDV